MAILCTGRLPLHRSTFLLGGAHARSGRVYSSCGQLFVCSWSHRITHQPLRCGEKDKVRQVTHAQISSLFPRCKVMRHAHTLDLLMFASDFCNGDLPGAFAKAMSTQKKFQPFSNKRERDGLGAGPRDPAQIRQISPDGERHRPKPVY
jgi:hypothetical protein